MSIEYKCVMLPTNEKAVYPSMATYLERIWLHEEQSGYRRKSLTLQTYMNGMDFINPQHLYILSSEEIKEGDWCIIDNSVQQVISFNADVLPERQAYYGNTLDTCYNIQIGHYECFPESLRGNKIIASTDPSLGLLPIPKSFIEEYISRYNAGDIITDVTVENKKINQATFWERDITKIKPLPKPIKESWNREEVAKAIHDCMLLANDINGIGSLHKFIDTWINKNL